MKTIPSVLSLIILSYIITGCTILGHLDELSVMGDFARDKDNQAKMIKLNDSNFENLVKTFHDGHMDIYKDKLSISNQFGQPVTILRKIVDGKEYEEWIYRKSLIREAKNRIVIKFDEKNQVVDIREEEIKWF